MSEQYGIDQTKELLDFVIEIIEAYGSVYEDKTIDLADVPALWSTIMKLPKAFEQIELVPFELGELSDDEQEQLVTHLDEGLELKDGEHRAILQAVFKAARANYELYKLLR